MPELPDDCWVDTPFEPFDLRPRRKPTPKSPSFLTKAWQCTECRTWQLEAEVCRKCGRHASKSDNTI